MGRLQPNRLTSFLVLITAIMLPVTMALAAEVPFELSFRDSVTGLAVSPDSVVVDGQEIANQLDARDRLSIAVPEGAHAVAVKAAGYRDMVARQTAVSGQTPLNVLLLDPLAPPAQARPEALRAQVIAEESLISGYVADEATARPLEGVEILVTAAATSVTTDAGGFFSVKVSVAGGQVVPDEAGGNRFIKTELIASRAGYVTRRWNNLVMATGDSQVLRVRMSAGSGTETVDMRTQRGRLHAAMFDGVAPSADLQPAPILPTEKQQTRSQAQALQAAPTTIRVGRDCPTKSTCTTVETMSLDTYAKHVLPHEWIASWNDSSLKAGAVAVRSYGAWYVYHPITSTYDICDDSNCQNFKDTTYNSTDNAVDATSGMFLVNSSGNITRAEYSAENNDLAGGQGCGDCYTINNANDSICLYDPVCCGHERNGHGRGMCQRGSHRWAQSPNNKPYEWMCDHYYSAYGWTLQNLNAPVITQQPAAQSVCPGGTATFAVAATGSGTLTYRWQKDGVNLNNGGHYSGVTTATLTVSSASAADAAAYSCVVTNASGGTPSEAADLTLKDANSILQSPQAQSICPGKSASFSVIAAGEAPAYQWQKDGANLSEGGHYSDVATATLTVSSADAADAGGYRCVVSGGCGPAVTSTAASLSLSGPEFSPADFDRDHDVDQDDFGHLQICFSGGAPQMNPDCYDARLNPGTIVDSADVAVFLNCFSGAGDPANTCCAP